MARVLKKLTFNRRKWITHALHHRDMSCALGFLDRALHSTAVFDKHGYMRLLESGYENSWQERVYETNDSQGGLMREKNLQAIFADKGIELDFADDLPGPVEAVFEDDTPAAEEVKLPEVKALTLNDLESASTETEQNKGRKLVVGQ